ncbi:hypothetical protein [Halomonas cerina]|uniref:Uncharacterized protein n=1 Tax=Halomonas cerina TaxID=447424 RepID=A0A839V181_9GAMM|nr:hypothetical protein [Halomonas cerina]MBB3188951.1 hypothetical protein [Halomonas cerina]
MNASRLIERLIALTVLATALFSPPLLLIADRVGPGGLSWLPLYLFVAWGLVIGLMAWLMEHRDQE